MLYPKVLTEDETLNEALSGKSIARYGDGELSLALGGDCIFQKRNTVLASELRKILTRPRPNLLVCIPNIEAPTKAAWSAYGASRFRDLYTDGPYGSAFISRPDSAPWIDRDDYWAKLARLWQGKDVTLVKGTNVSIRAEQLDALSVRVVHGPGEDAFSEIDRIDEEIGTPGGPVILCLGPTATVLAWRLSRRNVQGLDLGHVGLYMRHRGAYDTAPTDLASGNYREVLRQMHASRVWGDDGKLSAPTVQEFAEALRAKTVLDYGCGRGTLAHGLKDLKVQLYDPGVPKRGALPKPADLVVATDVLEHVEPARISAVLRHIWLLAGKGVYLTIGTAPADAVLPDGRNAHILVKPEQWWRDRICEFEWSKIRFEPTANGKGIRVWLTK
jgi:hypothetical protein